MKRTNFGWALDQLKAGGRVSRLGWHKSGMYLGLQNPDEHSANTLPYIYLCIPKDKQVNTESELGGVVAYDRIPWLASQTDILADDWVGIEG